MFKHLLVPLDGSALAETTLPAAVYLAQTLKASVTLIHVVERHAPRPSTATPSDRR
jgi:nucleotide-binding universal stress UspA family protein